MTAWKKEIAYDALENDSTRFASPSAFFLLVFFPLPRGRPGKLHQPRRERERERKSEMPEIEYYPRRTTASTEEVR